MSRADPLHSGIVALGHVTDCGYPVVTVAVASFHAVVEWRLVSGLPVENRSSPCFHFSSFPQSGACREHPHAPGIPQDTVFTTTAPFPPFAVFGHPLLSALLVPGLPPASFPAMIRLRELRDLISHPDSSSRVDSRPR